MRIDPPLSDDCWTAVNVDVGRTGTTVVGRPGDGGTALVLCHSLGLDHRLWNELTARLPSEISVLAYDVRNHGTAKRMTTFTLAECADDLLEILDEFGLGRVHVAGLSMGGAIAQEFALRHPGSVSGLTLMGTSGRTPGSMRERAETGPAGLSAKVDETLARWFTPEFQAANGAWVAYARTCLLDWDVDSWSASWLSLGERDVLHELARVRVPALCLAGTDDVAAPVAALQALADALPDSRLEVVPGGHLFPIEAPDETAQAVARHHARLARASHRNIRSE